MLIQVYEADEFVKQSTYEEKIIYFECRHNTDKEGYSFERFIKECMTKEILIDSFYTLNLVTNRRKIAKNVNRDYSDEIEEIEFDILYEVWEMLDDLLVDSTIKRPDTVKRAVRIYDHDWTYLFYAIEGADGYYAYNWTKEN